MQRFSEQWIRCQMESKEISCPQRSIVLGRLLVQRVASLIQLTKHHTNHTPVLIQLKSEMMLIVFCDASK